MNLAIMTFNEDQEILPFPHEKSRCKLPSKAVSTYLNLDLRLSVAHENSKRHKQENFQSISVEQSTPQHGTETIASNCCNPTVVPQRNGFFVINADAVKSASQ
jgi:hypothetical protein